MAQTTQIAPGLRAMYKKIFGWAHIDGVVHLILEWATSIFAFAKGFSFPDKFNWEWKLEMLLGRYEVETTALFKQIVRPGAIVIDIGAHVGYFTRLFSSLVGESGKVYGFEADGENYHLLKKNTAWCRNVTLIQKAVSNADGSIDFYHIENSTGCHSTVRPDIPARKTSVPAVSIDSFVHGNNIQRVDVIKMDIEGAEPLALQGMRAMIKANPELQLVTEFNSSALSQGGTDPIVYLRELESCGFNLYGITEDELVPITSRTDMSELAYFHRTGYINILCKKE